MIRHSKDGYCISLPFVVKCSCKPPEKTTTLLPPVITTDNNLITAHRIGLDNMDTSNNQKNDRIGLDNMDTSNNQKNEVSNL